MDNELARIVPPNSVDAERSVIGALLQDKETAIFVFESLSPDDFYAPEHREIYSGMCDLNKNGSPIDIMTVSAELTRRGTLLGIGGTAYLLEAYRYVPTTANTRAYVKIVQEKSALRKMISTCKRIEEQCYLQMEETGIIMRNAEIAVSEVSAKRGEAETLQPMREVMMKTFEKIEEMSRLKGKLAGIPTGLHDLDRILTGLHGGELIIAGARPGMGKTALAIGIAQYAALRARKKVAFFTMEMPEEQIGMRLLCNVANVDMQHVRQGTLLEEEWVKLGDAINQLTQSDVYVDDTAALTPTQIRGRIRKRILNGGIDIAIIDYLGLMGSDKRTENKNQEIGEISRALKAMALELKIPFVVCAQLSRANAMRADKRPTLNDLRDSGSIEQDADVVLFIHREGYYKPKEEQANDTGGEIIIAKQRNGPVGTVEVEWQAKFARYANKAGTVIPNFED